MQIVTFDGNEQLKHQMAQLLVEAFHEHWADAWETFEDGLKEVEEMCEAERICLVAIEDEKLLGMIGGIPEYDGKVWELHPLAVQPGILSTLSPVSNCSAKFLYPSNSSMYSVCAL